MLERRFGESYAIDKRAVCRIQIFNDDIVSAQEHFAVVAGNRGFCDLKGVILEPANGDLYRFQFAGSADESFAEHDKFGHRSVGLSALSLPKLNGLMN